MAAQIVSSLCLEQYNHPINASLSPSQYPSLV